MTNQDHEINRRSWNFAAEKHLEHPELATMGEQLRDGHNVLTPEELDVLGDVAGQTVVHLQCNDGKTTLSIARHLGATVTGVDISDVCIKRAHELSEQSGIPGAFVRSDVFEWFASNTLNYDVVFLAYGCLVWISDIRKWAHGVGAALRPGGRLALVEYHPMPGAMDVDWTVKFEGMGGRPQTAPGVADYFSEDPTQRQQNPEPTKRFAWGISEVFTALQEAGFEVNRLREYPYSRGFARFPDLVATEPYRFDPPENRPRIPLMYSVVATKLAER